MTSLLEKFTKRYGRLPTEFDPDYLEMLNMSKVYVVDVPTRSPGKCANCGASKDDGRKYVDIGLYIEWYGDVYFCGYCIHEVTKKIGLFGELENKIAVLEKEVIRLEALKDDGKRLNELVVQTAAEIKEHYDSLLSNVAGSDLIRPPGVGISEEEPSRSGTSKTEQGITKPGSSGRSKDLPSLTDLLGTI
jgi:hypothetical protein